MSPIESDYGIPCLESAFMKFFAQRLKGSGASLRSCVLQSELHDGTSLAPYNIARERVLAARRAPIFE